MAGKADAKDDWTTSSGHAPSLRQRSRGRASPRAGSHCSAAHSLPRLCVGRGRAEAVSLLRRSVTSARARSSEWPFLPVPSQRE